MKKFLITIVLGILIIQNWDFISNTLNPLPDYSAEHESGVVLYATSWCGYCAKTRKLLREYNIPYFEYDIEKSEKGHEQYKNLKGKAIPLLQIKGKVVRGYDPQKIVELANEL